MGIRALCAAAAVIAGMVSAADAASVRYDLRYIDTVLDDAVIFDSMTGEVLLYSPDKGPLSVHDPRWDFSMFDPGLRPGDLTDAYMEYEDFPYPPEWDHDPGQGEDYIVPVCWIGNFNCEVDRQERMVIPELFLVSTDVFGVGRNGTTFYAYTEGNYHREGFRIIGEGYEGSAASMTSTFELVELAPVPLPASAALLPLGFGALALMRRRRRT